MTETYGHREYVGGRWDEIGKLTFRFLLDRGLLRDDVVLDIGCGSFRVGRFLIPYLDEGHYLGLDSERSVVESGLKHEIERSVLASKIPEIVITETFDFQAFTRRPTMALAQSVFTHLTKTDILLCLGNLAKVMKRGDPFYATFHRSDEARTNPAQSHPHERFEYTVQEMDDMAKWSGWAVDHIGEWGHPRRQEMLCFRRP